MFPFTGSGDPQLIKEQRIKEGYIYSTSVSQPFQLRDADRRGGGKTVRTISGG